MSFEVTANLGVGLTVTVMVNGVPEQASPPVVVMGVTEYVAVCAELVGFVRVTLILV